MTKQPKNDLTTSSTKKWHKKYRIQILLITILFIISFNVLCILFLFSTLHLIQANTILEGSLFDQKVNSFPFFKKSEELPITARAVVVYDPEARVIVYGNNEHLRFTPASSAKIMTALVTLEEYDLDTVLTARNPERVLGSKMGLFNGEKITVENALYGLLLPSGNDAAMLFAQNYPSGAVGFVARMNQEASLMNLENTLFVDPSGYEDANYTTAYDLARLASVALQNETFQKIVQTKTTVIYNSDYTISHSIENLNKLLYEDGVTGVKTGFTNEAGGVLVTSINISGRTYVVVVLKSIDRFYDTQQVIDSVVKKIQLIDY